MYVANGSDYIATTTMVTFLSGMTNNESTQCVEIQIIDDDIYEEDEVFLVSISTVMPPSSVMIGTQFINKTIWDNAGRDDVKKL